MQKSVISAEYQLLIAVLIEMRKRQGVTQAELADILDIPQQTVSRCERLDRRLDVIELRHWCAALGTTLQALIEEFENALGGPKGRSHRAR